VIAAQLCRWPAEVDLEPHFTQQLLSSSFYLLEFYLSHFLRGQLNF